MFFKPHHHNHSKPKAPEKVYKQVNPISKPVSEEDFGDIIASIPNRTIPVPAMKRDVDNASSPINYAAMFSSPVVGSAGVFIHHNDDPEEDDQNHFGIIVDVDNPAFQKAVLDLTIYDKDMNPILGKDDIAAIGVTVKEEYARPMVDAVDSISTMIRYKYNQLYDLQRTIIEDFN